MSEIKKSGFTLIELMLVVAIIGILSSLALPKFADFARRAREAKTKGNLGVIRSALNIYYADNEGHYPNDPSTELTAGGKYISAIPFGDVPPYHFANGISLSMTAGVFYEYAPSANIIWHYRSPLIYPSPENGFFCVACIHQDSRGNVWTSF